MKTFYDIKVLETPYIAFIEDIGHAIVVFPDGSIFNCNPRDYPLPITKEMTDGLKLKQVEPSIDEYENYWNRSNAVEGPFIQNDQNCLLWCGYYLNWILDQKEKSKFPSTLVDLENWCKKTIQEK